jgi:DNA-cytosine methyltransferase
VIYILDLFSGIGGFTLASQWVGGYMTLAFCEIEDYCRKVLSQNFPDIPIFTDVRELHPTDVIPRDGVIHLITAGFPCQDLSVAGNQAGIEADRSGLFFQILRLSDEFYAYSRVRPSLLLENVPNLLTGDGGDWARTVYSELAVRGYRCEWKIISASDVGAPHLRKRWWCLAYLPNSKYEGSRFRDSTEMGEQSREEKRTGDQSALCTETSRSEISYSKGLHGNVSNDHSRVLMEGQSIFESGDRGREDDMAHTKRMGWSTGAVEQGEDGGGIPPDLTGECSEALPNTYRKGLERQWPQHQLPESKRKTPSGRIHGSRSLTRLGGALPDGLSPWMDEPADLPRVTHEKKYRKQRLMSLGNSIVPAVAMIPLRRFKEIHENQFA